MRKTALTASLIAILFAGCTPNEDLVRGSIPPKEGTNIVSITNRSIIYWTFS